MPWFKRTTTTCLVCQTHFKLEHKRCPHCFVSAGKYLLEPLDTPEAVDIPREVPRTYDGYPSTCREQYEHDVAVMGRAGWTATQKQETGLDSRSLYGHISVIYVPDAARLKQQDTGEVAAVQLKARVQLRAQQDTDRA